MKTEGISLEQCYSQEIVKGIITHPEVYPYCSDDGSPSAEAFFPAMGDNIVHLLVVEEGKPGGVFSFYKSNHIMWELHTSMLPSCRGIKSKSSGVMAIAWMFNNTGCGKVITFVPSFNKAAARAAVSVGMIREGVIKESFIKNYIKYDQIIFGITKGT